MVDTSILAIVTPKKIEKNNPAKIVINHCSIHLGVVFRGVRWSLTVSNKHVTTARPFQEYHTDNTVHFSLSMLPDKVAQAEQLLWQSDLLSTWALKVLPKCWSVMKYGVISSDVWSYVWSYLELYGLLNGKSISQLVQWDGIDKGILMAQLVFALACDDR